MTDKPQRVLPVHHLDTDQHEYINLDYLKTREDVIRWVKFYNPQRDQTYIDIAVNHLWNAIKHARGEDDITTLENMLKQVRSLDLGLDTSSIEKSIRNHYRRRAAFHGDS